MDKTTIRKAIRQTKNTQIGHGLGSIGSNFELTPTLSGLHILRDATLMIQIRLVSKLFANIYVLIDKISALEQNAATPFLRNETDSY